MELPTLDLRKSAERQFIRDMDHICSTSGFFQLIGHGVPQSTLLDLASLARLFFALPLERKLEIRQPSQNTIRGYIPFGRGALAYTRNAQTPPDLKESFNVGPLSQSPTTPKAAVHYANNLWPHRPAELREACVDYYRTMETLCHRLLQLFASAAGLAPGGFDIANAGHVSVLGLAYYPAQHDTPLPGQLRSGAHTDFGSVTLLWPETGSSGLEVALDDGRWQPVLTQPGALVVNIGDVLEHWTAKRWRSVLHRVANPSAEHSNRDRLSIGFFHHPNPSLSMTGPTFDRPYDDAITFGEYLANKFESQIRRKS